MMLPPLLLAATTPSSLYWSNLAVSLGNALWDQSASHHYIRMIQHDNGLLQNKAYHCNGMVIGFSSDSEIYCQGATSGTTWTCGTYVYKKRHVPAFQQQELRRRQQVDFQLSGTTLSGPFVATELEWYDEDILVSFVAQDVTCHIVSLDFESYSANQYLGLSCPPQNTIPNTSHQANHFSLGPSGDVALRSQVNIYNAGGGDSSSKTTSHDQVVVWDSYGVYYQRNQEGLDGTREITMLFGPQQGRRTTVLSGTLREEEPLALHIDNYEPTGPCVHDGTSPIDSLTELVPTNHDVLESSDADRNNVSLFSLSAVFLLSTLWTTKELIG